MTSRTWLHCARVASAACCAVSVLLPPVARGQEPPQTVVDVKFVGLERMAETAARSMAAVRVGTPAEPSELDAAVERLLRTGRFLTVRYDLSPREPGVVVTFTVRERPRVTAVTFQGNRHFAVSQLQKEVGAKVGDLVDPFVLQSGAQAIRTMYREAGYMNVTVTVDEEGARRSGEVVYRIDEGLQVRIRDIRYEGAAAFDARTLSRQVQTKTAWWIFRTGAFDVDRVGADVLSLQNFYHDHGFLDARVSYRSELAHNQQDMTLVFVVDEATRYRMEKIEFRGNTVFSTEELAGLTESREGAFVDRPGIDRDVRAIHTRYGDLGYIYAAVRAVRVFSDDPGLVRLTFIIEEGDQYRVGRVVVRGNARTKDKVIRRTLNLYPPDDLFSLTEAREAEQRLKETRILSSARVVPIGDRPGVRDVLIDVTESDKAGDLLFGFGVTSNSGLVGSVVLDLRNFDLHDRPRNLNEFVKFRSFFGAGQHLRIEALPGTTVNRFRFDFTEPYLWDRPIRFDLSGYYFERGRDGYTEERTGATVSFGKRFERGPWHGWAGEVSLRAEDVTIDDIDLFASGELRDVEGSNFITGLKGSMLRDRTDSRFVPSVGDRLRVGYEQVVGEHNFGRLTASYRWYRTIDTDAMGRKKVLQLSAEGGVILGDAPIFERFFAGGTGSIRGFEFRGVGERDGIDETNVGGDYLVLLGAEYSYPLIGDNIRGHLFLDTGAAGRGTYRAAVGTGFRLTLDIFGGVPLEFNLGIPVSKDSDDEEQVFSFLVGGLF